VTGDEVLRLYGDLHAAGIPIWIDGGWCVDALIGRQTRDHEDVDIAIDRRDETRLRATLTSWGYVQDVRHDTTEWNYVLRSGALAVDVHVFQFDADGNHIYGVEYPNDALTGAGTINGHAVRCIAPRWMFTFKTGYEPREKDIRDVLALSERFGFELPAGYGP
jgi:lincosamide nucleotidyltransferase A/C/D/E